MGKWFRQILQGEHSLFRLSLPFRVRLFNVLALVGGMISLINGISSYANNQDSVILGLNFGIAVLSFVLLFYAYKSGRYQFCYVVTIITIFLVMFPYLFFKSGGYKGGMVSFYIFGILFTVFMLEGKAMFFTAFTEMVVYIATIMIAYQNPQMVVWFSSEKEVVMDLLIGFCASSISVAAVMYLHFRMYNKQQEILEEARIEAQSANKAKSAFLANMSHEIRTPINVMLGMNEMILRESESKEIRQYAKSIERSGGYLISLINNILDISRIESGKMEIEEGKYELRQLLDEVMLIAEKQAEQKSLKMNLIFDKTLPAYLIGDVIHIKQILLNLINNAVKYTKEGQIDIKVSKNAEETKLIFEVKDTGIGIKEENLPVLFDAFMRVDSKKNKKIKGTGLGLAIAKQLAEQGVRELILVAQETTIYGTDLYGKKSLHLLLKELCKIPGIVWIRVLYCYPEEIYPELIETIRDEKKICHYLDLPIQHASDKILKRMGRRTSKQQLIDMVSTLRREIPDIVLRTTLITGFPGETQEDHEELMEFVDQMEFDRLGVFTYSPEEDTPAATMEDQIPEEVKQDRQAELMELQQEISLERGESCVGKDYLVMIEGKVADENAYVGRTYADAPGIDGYMFINTGELLMSGDFVKAHVTGSLEYDLIGEIADEYTE